MSKNDPLLSIGMPVYNGANFIREALDSILSQTFENFELIISDNASTDATEKICREYVARDSRIHYYRSEQNLGAAWNFNRVFELSSGKYFKWAAHDDVLAPNFLLRCVEVLERDPSVLLCHSQAKVIDDRGSVLQEYKVKLNTNSPKPQERFHELLNQHLCFPIFGVIRTSILRKIEPLMGNYSHADGILLLKFALLGRFYEIPEYLFFYRKHAHQSISLFSQDFLVFNNDSENSKQSIDLFPDFHAYTLWFDPAKKGKILFPHWRIFSECMISVWEAPLTWYEKICCYLAVIKQWNGGTLLLIKDLLVVFPQILNKFKKFANFKLADYKHRIYSHLIPKLPK
ncbi:MAG: glycosyltransferase [Calothrix sp. MO_167.B42]|nr:glycosyltransferase [Calothrix sp. MO_167.B42]